VGERGAPRRRVTFQLLDKPYHHCAQLKLVASPLSRPTTITVTERTRRRLEAVKGDGETFDELIQGLLEESAFDEDFYKEIERRWRSEKRIPWARVSKKAGLA
jgi:hypothetical protein